MATKKLNPKQAKFVKLYAAGGMSRSEAYMAAYGQKNRDTARTNAASLIASNGDVKAEIDKLLDEGLESAKEMLRSESVATVEKLTMLREMGNKEYAVQLAACKDILDRIGLKPKEQLEHSGAIGSEVVFNFGNIITEDDI